MRVTMEWGGTKGRLAEGCVYALVLGLSFIVAVFILALDLAALPLRFWAGSALCL